MAQRLPENGESAERVQRTDIARIRRFNRFYTQRIGVVGQIGNDLSLPAARLLFEAERLDKPSSSDLANALSLDPGYVSRRLARLAERGLIHKARSKEDGRRHVLSLTEDGQELHRRLSERANRDVEKMLEPLGRAGRRRLVEAMETIEHLIGEQPTRAPLIREHGPGDIGWVLCRHGELYQENFGFDHRFEALVGKILTDFALDHDPRRERLWVADDQGQRLGSVMLISEGEEATAARLRLFLVEPHARGRGVGTLLMENLLDFARRRGYKSIVLSTVDALHAARRIYERAGFRLTESFPHSDWSVDVVEQVWLLDPIPGS